MTIVLIVGALIVVVLLIAVVAFNRLRTRDIAAQEALGGIDVQLTRRADLIPNLSRPSRATPPTRRACSRL
jgi:LemA protein